MNTYLFSYTHDGSDWCFEVQAENEQDARTRVAKMAYARYDGELQFKLPAWLPMWTPDWIITVLNAARKK